MKRWIVLGAVLALTACEEKQQPQPPTAEQPASAATNAATQVATQPQPEIASDQVPTPEDFEREATEQITAENFKEELESLRKEIDEES